GMLQSWEEIDDITQPAAMRTPTVADIRSRHRASNPGGSRLSNSRKRKGGPPSPDQIGAAENIRAYPDLSPRCDVTREGNLAPVRAIAQLNSVLDRPMIRANPGRALTRLYKFRMPRFSRESRSRNRLSERK